ncbi:hypothetical protein SFRURICE_015706, partial [Spodoptera frugiperda]
MPSKPLRDASGRFQSKRPSQGEPNGPSQGQPNGPSQGQPDDISVSDTSRAPSAASLFCRADDSSDCESVTEAVASTSRYLKRAYLRQESDDSSESVIGRTKKAKAKSSSHDVGLDEAQRQLRASLAQAKRVEVQKDLEEKVAAKERATGAARSRAGYGASNAPKPSKGKGKGKKSQVSAPLAPSTCADAQVKLGTVQAAPLSQPDDAGEPSATPPTETWTEVVKRGKKKKTVPKITPAAPAANRAPAAPLNKGVKLAAPRSAAVTVTITPEAAERGETYESVLTRARGFADPIQLGIGPIKCRLPRGRGFAKNADLFAAKLREGIADVAKVARPVKSATLEVVDLDDSVSVNEVVAAIAAAGGCSVEAVHGRTIWTGRRGLGMTRVDCPVTAAKA